MKEDKKAKKEQKVKTEKVSKKDKKVKKEKPEKPNKFIETIKKKWLINGTKTFLLVVIILGIFIGISVLMKKLNLTPIDLTEDKLFTLTSESKEKVKDIDKDINIYFVGYSDDDSTLDLAKQYTKANEKIIRFVAISLKEKFPITVDNVKDKYGIISYKTNKLLEN